MQSTTRPSSCRIRAWSVAAWVCSPAGVKRTYVFRPDVLLAFCLAVGWLATTIAVERRSARAALVMWLAAGLAALVRVPGFAVERFSPWAPLAVIGPIALGA